MTAKLPDNLVRDLVDDYRNGMSLANAARKHGVSTSAAAGHIRSAGLIIERRFPKRIERARITLPDKEIVRRYVSGESQNGLAKEYGVDRIVILRRLRDAGVRIRGSAETNRIMMSARSSEENRRNTQAAHEAARGRVQTDDERCRAARSRERCPSNIGPNEPVLAELLADRGISTVPQKAIGRYNCDLAAEPVAVEVFGGNFHFTGRHWSRLPERTRYLLDSGWSVLMLRVTRGEPLTGSTADNVAAFIQEARRDPSRRREYWVIRSTGEFVAGGSADDDEFALIEAFRHAKDVLTRHRR